MKNLTKRGVFALLVASLSWGMASCHDDDPDYENVTPPEVTVAPNTLSGVITSISGDAIADATVTLNGPANLTAKSDAKGIYFFADVKAGDYRLKAEAAGKLTKEGELTVQETGKSQNLVWNAILPTEVKKEISISTTETSSGNVDTETLKGNEKAEVKVEATIPPSAVETEEGEEVKIIISPVYDANSITGARAVAPRADESTMLVGATLACSKSNANLKSAIDLSFNVDTEVATSVEAKQYKDGKWVTVNSRTEDGKVVIPADEFTSYGLFLGVSFSSSNATEPVSFDQNKWDNLYGSADLSVGSANYTYKVGTEIKASGTNVLTALLIEKLAQRFGATVSITTGSYPLNVTLPVGTILNVSGVQSKSNVAASAKGKSVSGTHYGTVTVTVTTANRQHTGGSN